MNQSQPHVVDYATSHESDDFYAAQRSVKGPGGLGVWATILMLVIVLSLWLEFRNPSASRGQMPDVYSQASMISLVTPGNSVAHGSYCLRPDGKRIFLGRDLKPMGFGGGHKRLTHLCERNGGIMGWLP